jgi:hypothetical protein
MTVLLIADADPPVWAAEMHDRKNTTANQLQSLTASPLKSEPTRGKESTPMSSHILTGERLTGA